MTYFPRFINPNIKIMKEKEIDYEVAQDKLNDECGGGSSHYKEEESDNKLLWLAAVVTLAVAATVGILCL